MINSTSPGQSGNEVETHNILVVEDNADLNSLYCKAMRRAGYNVDQAMTIQEARELITSQTFDILLCDIRMGDGYGTNLLREQMVRLKQAGTQTIVVSAEPQYQDICEEMGIEFFVMKPVRLGMLVDLVERLLSSVPE